jgi:DNA-binding CsgD family transcriptional regulator
MHKLTTRETIILFESENNTAQQLADKLSVSTCTINEALHQAYLKLNVNSKPEALRKAKRQGYTNPLESK